MNTGGAQFKIKLLDSWLLQSHPILWGGAEIDWTKKYTQVMLRHSRMGLLAQVEASDVGCTMVSHEQCQATIGKIQ